MGAKLTEEQTAAVGAAGKVIVSASAGSGKTFVMIRKIADLIEGGGDLDEVLAVTFTKKAAAQMKEKLRAALIARLPDADREGRERIKSQLAKIPSADISTIHSFCAHLIRTYFYALDIDSSFDIIAGDDAQAATYKATAAENLFDRLYEEEDGDFLRLLSVLRRKRSDDNLRYLLLESYETVRNNPDYVEFLKGVPSLYCEEGFERVCRETQDFAAQKARACAEAVEAFGKTFEISEKREKYQCILNEMIAAFTAVAECGDIFAPLPPFTATRRPAAGDGDREAGERFASFRENMKAKYDGLYGDLSDRATEYEKFLKSGETACAFASLLLRFDGEYAAVKRDEGKLDYSDLEHLCLRLLKNDEIRAQIQAKYKHVFVDEYQDVNPVQERILNGVGGGDVFTVGDVKQAIYGFRGSKSLFFAQKYNRLREGDGSALRLSSNFRSSDGVVNFVNALFSDVMVNNVCGFDYRENSRMVRGGAYPGGYGSAGFYVFGKEENEREEAAGVYSVAEHASGKPGHTAEGLAVLHLVEQILRGTHYDLESKSYVPTQTGDICILTRKRAGKSVTGIVRALTDAGYSVAGAGQYNLCARPEIRQLLDILSFIDNSQQDVPLVSALLSAVGGFSRDDLAHIKMGCGIHRTRRPSFRECALGYAVNRNDELAVRLAAFYAKIYNYRRLSDVLGAARLIDKILEDSGLAAAYSRGNGEKAEAVRRLQEEAYSPSGELSLNAFLAKLKAGGYKIAAPTPSGADCIKIMTMHASKGLEFPVVILADVCASFKGNDYSDMPYDDEYGFAPKYYDAQSRTYSKSLLRRLCATRAAREEIKNELNLFYVACTRAMCDLYVMSAEVKPYDPTEAFSADNYASLCDISAYSPHYMERRGDFDGERTGDTLIADPDPGILAAIRERFMRPYAYADSVHLPVKSSASKLLKAEGGEPRDGASYARHAAFPEEEEDERETGAERGTAYHRFLQLCDFTVRDETGVREQLAAFTADGRMTEDQASLLSTDNLVKILNMPVFSDFGNCTCYREREFLCRLPACLFEDTSAEDWIVYQGAIDLLAIGARGTAIVDYKYSKKSDEEIVRTYGKQLALYKKVVSRILKIDENAISTTIVNIFTLREIPVRV